MDNKGWIKLHRKVLDNPVVCRDAEHLAVWMYLLLEATHDNIDKMFAGRRTTLKPGELITGRKVISVKLNISESKVQRILKRFEIEQQIEQQTSTTSRRISIHNWSEYQESEQQTEQQLNSNRTTSEQRVNTLQECKNERMEEGYTEANASATDAERPTDHEQINYKDLIHFFNTETMGVFGRIIYPISEKRKASIRARIREHGRETFAEMIRRAAGSNFLRGENAKQWKATFDWMIKPNNFQKIIEGNYDNKNQQNNGRPGPSGQNRAAQGITDYQLAEAIRRGTARALKENAPRD